MELAKAEKLAKFYIDLHLTGRGWNFAWMRRKKTFGICDFKRKQILLSKPLVEVNIEEQVKDTILHEIAHAIAGFAAGHGPVWKSTCVALGAKPQRLCTTAKLAEPKWVLYCPKCGRTTGKNRRPKYSQACVSCSRKHYGIRASLLCSVDLYENKKFKRLLAAGKLKEVV